MVAYARKEIAFAKWKASGYRDTVAHAEYLHWFDICQKELPAMNNDQFKNEQYRRGYADGHAGKPNYYGCHVGMRSTLEAARESYRRGYEDGRAEVRAEYLADCKADCERTGRF